MYRLTIPSTLALMALASASVLSNAEVKTQHGIKKPTDLTKVEARVSARDTSNLRCWQYGELLFEETHLSEKKLSSTDNMLVFGSGAGRADDDREIYLINAGSATCLYEKI